MSARVSREFSNLDVVLVPVVEVRLRLDDQPKDVPRLLPSWIEKLICGLTIERALK